MRVVITGATGSLGRALTRSMLAEGITVVAFSRDELKQAQLAEDMGHPDNLRMALGDVRDRDRLDMAFRSADAVVHAAALKRVDAIAQHADETVKTNILGTVNVCRAAMDRAVPKVLFISSDKAVTPTNSYGASKAMAEWVSTGFNTYSVPAGTRIACLRYGNVLGSRGSVVHIWRQAIERGEPLPLTDPGATRFIITMDQAVAAVRRSLQEMSGGEIFVPKLPWAFVEDIGRAMVGIQVDSPFQIIGLRPGGEKIHEALLSDEERHRCADTTQAYVVIPSVRSWGGEGWTKGKPAPPYASGSPHVPRMLPSHLRPLIDAVPEGGLF